VGARDDSRQGARLREAGTCPVAERSLHSLALIGVDQPQRCGVA
jgi:hypothetical protein